MKSIERKGTSIPEILGAFQKEYKLKPHQYSYKVVREASAGLFGFLGKRMAMVSFRVPEVTELLTDYLEKLLAKMGSKYDSINVRPDGDSYNVSILNVAEPGFMIGKEGRMLENLQFILNRTFENITGSDKIILDIDGYRQRQEAKLLQRIRPLLERAKTRRQSITLDPMSSSERRVIHKFVENDSQLRTLTVGDGRMKRIVIFPAGSKAPHMHPRPNTEQQTNPHHTRSHPQGTRRNRSNEPRNPETRPDHSR